MIRSATITVAFVLGLAASTAQAAFENVDISPRARAMGGAAVAVSYTHLTLPTNREV